MKTLVFLSVALVASLGMLLPQQHGEDAQCTNVCWPSDGREGFKEFMARLDGIDEFDLRVIGRKAA